MPEPFLSFPMLLHVAHDIPAHLMIHDAPKVFALEFLQIGTKLSIKLRKASNILIKIFAAQTPANAAATQYVWRKLVGRDC